ncbi:MAG: ribosome-associated translation inhibitor RaiA [Saprospiraceae bacterium]|nr:ribosome-associated translation inhibitor RaiA [Saprospiraceae bacterium]
MKISVQSVNFHADSKLLEFVEKKVSRLERLFDKVVEAEIYLKVQDTGAKVKEKVAEIRLRIPGSSLVDKKSGMTFESTITSAVETLKRQLVRHKQKNGTVKRTSERPAHVAHDTSAVQEVEEVD